MTTPEQGKPGPEVAADPSVRAEALRERLVQSLWMTGALTSGAVDRAMRAVPRHLFLPASPLEEAYADIAVPTHWEDDVAVSSASQPAIVAVMLQQLAVEPGQRVLEIGAGTGYNAALLAELTGPSGSVTALDIDPVIVSEARAHLAAAGYPAVAVQTVDGAEGWPAGAPYDRIILTVGADDIALAWFDQLAEGGILVLPLKLSGGQVSVAFRKRDGVLTSESLTLCGFMRLRGAMAVSGDSALLPDGRRLWGDGAADLVPAVCALLKARPRVRLGYRVSPDLLMRLALHGARTFMLLPRNWDGRGRRARHGIFVDSVHGPSLALYSNALPLLFTFGSEAAQRLLDDAQAQPPAKVLPVEQWRIECHLRAAASIPTPPGAIRIARRSAIFDVWVGESGD
jgi:protein-L-isoaspartate(D-aspartate) O-methyltransferase